MIREAIKQLELLGQMPEDDSEDVIDKYSNLLDEIEEGDNISYEEGQVLVKLFPESSFYDLEWQLLHLVESLLIYSPNGIEQYRELIKTCPSKEWRETLETRLRNGLSEKN